MQQAVEKARSNVMMQSEKVVMDSSCMMILCFASHLHNTKTSLHMLYTLLDLIEYCRMLKTQYCYNKFFTFSSVESFTNASCRPSYAEIYFYLLSYIMSERTKVRFLDCFKKYIKFELHYRGIEKTQEVKVTQARKKKG